MDMNLCEVFVILVVTLLVIKPEHLPDVANKLGKFFKWTQHKIAKIKADIVAPFNPKSSDSSSHE